MCQISVGVLGDISRALEDQLQPFCNRLMQILLENLQSDAVNRNVKPQILSAFGDIALAIGDNYELYLSAVLSMLQSAQVSSLRGAPCTLPGMGSPCLTAMDLLPLHECSLNENLLAMLSSLIGYLSFRNVILWSAGNGKISAHEVRSRRVLKGFPALGI